MFSLSRDFLNHALSMCILQSLCVYFNLYVYTTISMHHIGIFIRQASDCVILTEVCENIGQMQCDHIGRFFEVFGDKYLQKAAKMYED